MPINNIAAFTVKSNVGLLRVLITDVYVHIPGNDANTAIKAIWDTGASGSAITKKVVQQLG
jgi:hypothetical protein